jgi:HEAT repeat protein
MTNINSCLDLAKAGRREAAFHCLFDLGASALPRLTEAYRAEADPAVRDLLVEVIWQLRSPSSIDFLGEALQDPDPEVWKQALDGLVTLASPESLRILQSARDTLRVPDDDFREWVEGAIEDVSGRIDE